MSPFDQQYGVYAPYAFAEAYGFPYGHPDYCPWCDYYGVGQAAPMGGMTGMACCGPNGDRGPLPSPMAVGAPCYSYVGGVNGVVCR